MRKSICHRYRASNEAGTHPAWCTDLSGPIILLRPGRILPNTPRNNARIGRTWPTVDRNRPKLAQIRPKLAETGPDPVDIGLNPVKLVQSLPNSSLTELGPHWRHATQLGRTWTECGRGRPTLERISASILSISAWVGPASAKFCPMLDQSWSMRAQIRSNPTQHWSTSANIWAKSASWADLRPLFGRSRAKVDRNRCKAARSELWFGQTQPRSGRT